MYNYHCFNTENRDICQVCSNKGQVVTEQLGEYVCPFNESLLKHIGEIASGGIIGLRKDQLLKERKKRNHEHFKRDVLPDIADPDAKKHHFKKLGIKG